MKIVLNPTVLLNTVTVNDEPLHEVIDTTPAPSFKLPPQPKANAMLGYITVPDGTKDAGIQTYWSISGPTNVEDFKAAWAAAGLDAKLLPTPQTDEYNLRAAMVKLRQKRYLLRPLAKEGFALVAERADTERVDHAQDVSAKLVPNSFNELELVITPADHPLADQIKANYEQSKREWTVDHISSWLVKLAARNDAVGMRPMGGIYFMPPASVSFWEQVSAVIEANTPHVVYRIPTMNTKGAVKAILDAVLNDVTEKADHIAGDIHDNRSGELGKRALQGRVSQADGLLSKLESYEEVLGSALDSIKSRLMSLRGDAVAALLLADDVG